MAQTLRILGQLNPAAMTLTTLYTVPTNAECIVRRLFVCNQTGAGTFRIAINRNGAVAAAKSYLYYDTALAANASLIIEELRLGPNDSIQVYASSTGQSFSAFGEEFALSGG